MGKIEIHVLFTILLLEAIYCENTSSEDELDLTYGIVHKQLRTDHQQPVKTMHSKEIKDLLQQTHKHGFKYFVKDPHFSGSDFGHMEKTSGHLTKGSYYVYLPDGRKQTVRYHVDDDSGYVAQVSYEGEALHPQVSGPNYRPQLHQTLGHKKLFSVRANPFVFSPRLRFPSFRPIAPAFIQTNSLDSEETDFSREREVYENENTMTMHKILTQIFQNFQKRL